MLAYRYMCDTMAPSWRNQTVYAGIMINTQKELLNVTIKHTLKWHSPECKCMICTMTLNAENGKIKLHLRKFFLR